SGREYAGRVCRRELAHLDAGLRGEHVFLEPPRGELVEVALRVLHRELEQADVVVRHEIQRRRKEHALPGWVVAATAAENREQEEGTKQNAKHAHWDLASGGFGDPT